MVILNDINILIGTLMQKTDCPYIFNKRKWVPDWKLGHGFSPLVFGLELKHQLFGSQACWLLDWNLHQQLSWFSGFLNQTWTKTSAVLVLKPLVSGWNCTIGFP